MKSRLFVSAIFLLGLGVGALATVGAADMLGSTAFSDVQPGSYYDAPIGRLYSQGIVKGSGGMYKPADFVTRADIAVMLDRALNGDAASSRSSSSRSSRSSGSSVSSSSVSSSVSSVANIGEAGGFRFTNEKFNFPESASNITLAVQRYGGTKGSVTVHYETVDGTAKNEKRYNSAQGTLSFGDGETSKTISLHFINNLVADPNETFTVVLSAATGGAVVGTPSTTTVTVLDNDGGGGNATASSSSSSSLNSSAAASAPGGVITFSAWTYAVDEKAGSITINVLRKSNSSAAVNVDYATVAGSATVGTNYTDTKGTLSFAAGETSKSFTVPVIGQTSIDGNKSLTLKLTNPTGGALLDSPSTATLTVLDNEAVGASGSGTVMFSASTYTASRRDAGALITVFRRGTYTGTVTLNYATSDSTAIAGTNYSATSGSMTFAPGESAKTFNIPLLTATFIGEKNVNLTLSSLSGNAAWGTPNTGVLTIYGQ